MRNGLFRPTIAVLPGEECPERVSPCTGVRDSRIHRRSRTGGSGGGRSGAVRVRPHPARDRAAEDQHSELPASAANAGRRAQVTNSDQAPLVARARSHGGKDFRQLHVANAFATAVPAAEAAALAADPSVAAVVPDKLIKAPSLDRERPSKAAPGPVSNLVCPTDPSKPLTRARGA